MQLVKLKPFNHNLFLVWLNGLYGPRELLQRQKIRRIKENKNEVK